MTDRHTRRIVFAVLVALAPGVRVQAQAIDPFTMRAVKTASPPTVDGVVDAPLADAAEVDPADDLEGGRGGSER